MIIVDTSAVISTPFSFRLSSFDDSNEGGVYAFIFEYLESSDPRKALP